MAINFNVPSLSELTYALSQRKNAGDVMNQVMQGYQQGKSAATEQAVQAAGLQEKLSDMALKKSHAAYYNKRAELMGQDDMPVAMAVQLKILPEAVGAALLAADPNARIPSKNLSSVVSARNQDEKTDAMREMIAAINKPHDDEMKMQREKEARLSEQADTAAKLSAAKGLEVTAKNAPAVPADIPILGPLLQAGASRVQQKLPALAPLTEDIAQPSLRRQAQKDLQAATQTRRDILGVSTPSEPLKPFGNADPLLDDPYANAMEFATEEDLDRADLPDGTPVKVGGVRGFSRKAK